MCVIGLRVIFETNSDFESESEIRVLMGILAFRLSHGRITVLYDVFGVGDTCIGGFPSFLA